MGMYEVTEVWMKEGTIWGALAGPLDVMVNGSVDEEEEQNV